jgi:hypothetical protein
VRKICVVALLCLSISGAAQSVSYSPYSVYGVGSIRERTSSYNRSLGGSGAALRDPGSLNLLNPASYTAITMGTQLTEIGMLMERDQIQTTEDAHQSSTGGLSQINMWFRMRPRWASVIGLSPYSSVNYSIRSTKVLGDNAEAPVIYKGTGGLTQVYFGNGFQLTKNFSLGFNATYIFGYMTKREEVDVDLYSTMRLENNIYVKRPMLDVGMQYQWPIGNEGRSISVGATYGTSLRLSTSSDRLVTYTATGDTLFYEEGISSYYKLPQTISAGLSYQTPTSSIAVDARYKTWSTAKLEEDLTLTNTLRLSAGYEYRGKRNPVKYVDLIAWRAGVYAQNNYFILKDTPFQEWGFVAGLGFPIAGNRALLNLTYNFNKTGTTDSKLIEHRAHIIGFDLVIRDLWGIRRRVD